MHALKPIKIGPVEVASPVILAPMTAVTDLPFRKAVKRYGAGLTVSEMIASQAMIRETRQSLQKSLWDPSEEPVSMQLAGCEASVMAEAAKLNEQRGAAIIDINMGCPVRKVVNGWAGSALMRDLTTAAAIIDSTPNGFTLENTIVVPTDAETAWRALVDDVGRWWPRDHTWWGAASTLSIEPPCLRLSRSHDARRSSITSRPAPSSPSRPSP